MLKIRPFRGTLYNPDKVSGDNVVAPPYDIIPPELKETLYQKSPFNIVRIDFGKDMEGDDKGNNKYTRAREALQQWSDAGVLVTDTGPAFYAYEVDYNLAGENRRLRGVLALVKLVELGDGVYPHEATHSKPKADRLDLMRSCMANISPIFSLYNSPLKVTAGILDTVAENPYFTANDTDGAKHSLYKITDPSHIDLIKRELSDKSIFIADGHHRYEVALEFKQEMDSLMDDHEKGVKGGSLSDFSARFSASRPWDYVLMFLANMSDNGLTILPTHRMVKGITHREEIMARLQPHFSVSKLEGADLKKGIVKAIREGGGCILGLYLTDEKSYYVLKYKGAELGDMHEAVRGLDVVVLHELVLKKDLGITEVAYEMDEKQSVARAEVEGFDAVFFLNPTGVADVERVALAGLRMPPKSTYFYPKLLTGMVINSFKNQI
jgi:uncharacterized protein (DUF1015 family)